MGMAERLRRAMVPVPLGLVALALTSCGSLQPHRSAASSG